MKYLKQFTIIALISFCGEVLAYYIPINIPGSVYGLVIMFILLSFGALKVDQIKETSSFLLSIMSVMFIPSAVGIVDIFSEMKSMLLPLLVITVVTTLLVMVVSGKLCDILLGRKENE